MTKIRQFNYKPSSKLKPSNFTVLPLCCVVLAGMITASDSSGCNDYDDGYYYGYDDQQQEKVCGTDLVFYPGRRSERPDRVETTSMGFCCEEHPANPYCDTYCAQQVCGDDGSLHSICDAETGDLPDGVEVGQGELCCDQENADSLSVFCTDYYFYDYDYDDGLWPRFGCGRTDCVAYPSDREDATYCPALYEQNVTSTEDWLATECLALPLGCRTQDYASNATQSDIDEGICTCIGGNLALARALDYVPFECNDF